MITFSKACSIGAQAILVVTAFLSGSVRKISNVEHDPLYQKKDIDLVLNPLSRNEIKVEVKGDRNNTGNLFLETVSNVSKGTSGCFLYTEADYVYYLIFPTQTLYVIPVPEARAWFLENMARFKEAKSQTAVGSGSYQTKGRLVPIKDMLAAGVAIEVKSISRFFSLMESQVLSR